MSDSFENTAAQWFGADGRVIPAEVSFGADGEVRARNAESETRATPIASVSISPRVANIPRRIEFPDGVALTVADNDFVDAALRRASRMRGSRVMHVFESRAVWAMFFLALAALVAWSGLTRGVPAAGKIAAAAVSRETLTALSNEAREAMEARGILSASELSDAEKNRARDLFDNLASRFAEDDLEYRLLFRRMQFGGDQLANAFALPDGTIMLTDRLAELAEDGELTAVFAHEIGHARERHGVRQLAQAVGAAGLGALIFGDITGALGAALVSSGYSRAFEREADCFAYRALSTGGGDWRDLGRALRKMERDNAPPPPIIAARNDNDNRDANANRNANEKSGTDAAIEAGLERFANFLSTHPPTEARADPETHCNDKDD